MSKKPATSQDVAKLAGVSRTTVSFVLNDVKGIQISGGTRQKVLKAAEELKYVPNAAAQALASQRAKIIGLILTRSPHHIATDAFITQIVNGLLDVIHQHDMRLLFDIIEPEHQRKAYLQMARAKRIDGILLSGPRSDDDALKILGEEGFPTVLIGQLPGTGFCSVDVDNRAAAKNAVAHLVNLGHDRIACITNAQPSYTAAADRLAGYKDALDEAGLNFDESLVRYGDFDVESGYVQMFSLLEGGISFTSAFVASDTVALGAKAAIRDHGFNIPHDIALVGFDDLPFSQYTDPPLTTVHLPVVKLAQQGCNMLIQILQNEHPPSQQTILSTKLVIRKSCGASQL
ncbi:LacI family DNA-binding transcriptional regulator [Chloroflexota bacterium]